MEKRSRLLVAVLSCALALPMAAQSLTSCRKTLGVTWQDITNCMNALTMTMPYDSQLKGAVYGYVPPGQTTPVIAASGSLNTNSIVWLGSVSKPFTHIGALLAMQERGFDLTTKFTSLSGVEPSLVGDPTIAAKRRLTLGQILTHTAGFNEATRQDLIDKNFYTSLQPSQSNTAANSCFQTATGVNDPIHQYVGEPGLNNECVFVPEFPGSPTKVWKPARTVPLAQLGQFVMRYPIEDLQRYPRAYSNVSTLLAGWITEDLTGRTMNNYLRAKLFDPLQLTDTFYNPHIFPNDPVTKFHLLNENMTPPPDTFRIAHMENMSNGRRGTNETGPAVRACNGLFWCDVRDWPFLWPEGGLYSTADDMLTFLQRFRDHAIPALEGRIPAQAPNKSIRELLLEDLVAPDQTGSKSRTAGFVYARNGQAGDVATTEGTIFHGGFPGTYLSFDPSRNLGWFFATQRVMNVLTPGYAGGPSESYFQAFPEQFAEAKIFSAMLTSLVENVKPENLNFFFDASRALNRVRLLGYESRVPRDPNDPNDHEREFENAYLGCDASKTTCEYRVETDYNNCNVDNPKSKQWADLSANQRVMTLSGCAWPGNGSRTLDDTNGQFGPYRLRVGNGVVGQVASNLYPNAYSVALWVRPSSTNAASLFSRGGTKITHQIGIQNGRFIHTSWDTAGKRTVVGDLVTPNQWYFIVGTAVRNGPMTLWINGRRMAGNVTIGDFVSLGNATYSLGDAADGLPRFQGDVAVAALYTQELAQADILRNCNGMKYRFPNVPCG